MNDRIALTAEEKLFFNRLREHECAPVYNYTSTDMLTPERLQQVRAFEREVQAQQFWQPGRHPEWLASFTENVYRKVPYYRAHGRPPSSFEAIPSFGREVLQQEPWSLVPDDVSLEALTVYTTSGTTGSALAIPTHPNVSSMLLVLLEELLEPCQVRLPRGAGQVAIALLHCQQQTLTYPSISHFLGGAGFLKLNLAEHAWRDKDHRARFLREAAPTVVTGSPYAFEVLSQVAPDLRPKALISSAVALHAGHAARLQETFGCPVLDLYSLTEARAIAGRRPTEEDDFALLSHDLYVEILGPDDEPMGHGEVGEIVVSGGRNPFFPLLRYRTGDRAALVFKNGRPGLSRFEGRQDVRLENSKGETVPTLDVVQALKTFPLVGFALGQKADRSARLDYCGKATAKEIEAALEVLLGTKVSVKRVAAWEGKPHRFTSELRGA